jgi:hypothetical protein
MDTRRVLGYQRGIQNPYVEEEQTTPYIQYFLEIQLPWFTELILYVVQHYVK